MKGIYKGRTYKIHKFESMTGYDLIQLGSNIHDPSPYSTVAHNYLSTKYTHNVPAYKVKVIAPKNIVGGHILTEDSLDKQGKII